MTGILLAVIFGSLQFYLLLRGIRSIAARAIKVWPFVCQFFCPFVCLGLCALLAQRELLICACVLCAILVGGALIYFFKVRKQEREKV